MMVMIINDFRAVTRCRNYFVNALNPPEKDMLGASIPYSIAGVIDDGRPYQNDDTATSASHNMFPLFE